MYGRYLYAEFSTLEVCSEAEVTLLDHQFHLGA